MSTGDNSYTGTRNSSLAGPNDDLATEGLAQLASWYANSESLLHRRPMPPILYTSSSIHRLELDRIFDKQWLCIGHTSKLAKTGDYLTFDFAKHPVFAIRDQSNNIRAYSNVCPHRSSRLLEGSGNRKLVVCPYHAWTYELNGNLRGAPRMKSAQLRDVRLNEMKVDTWQGLIFVSLSRSPEKLGAGLDSLRMHIAGFDLAGMKVVHSYDGEIDCNWKVLVENFCESYHLFNVHKETLESDTPTASARIMPGGVGYNHHTLDIVARESRGKKERMGREHLCCIYPCTTVAISDSRCIWLSIVPLASGRLKFRAWLAKTPGADGVSKFSQDELNVVEAFMHEDKLINTGVQQGLETGVGNRGPLSDLEQTNWEFGRYYAERMLGKLGTNRD